MEIIISLERQELFRAGKFTHFLLPNFFEPGLYQMIDQDEQSKGYAVIQMVQDAISGRAWTLDQRKAIAKQCGFTLGGLNKSIRSTHFGRRFMEGERYMRLFKAAYMQTAEGSSMGDIESITLTHGGKSVTCTPEQFRRAGEILQESLTNLEVPFYLRLRLYDAEVEAVKIYKRGDGQLMDVTFGLKVMPADITDEVLCASLFVPNETGGLQVPDVAMMKPRDTKTKAWLLHVERNEGEDNFTKIVNFFPSVLKFKGMEPHGGDLPCAKFIITAQGIDGKLSGEQWFNSLYRLEFESKKPADAEPIAVAEGQTKLTDFTE